MLLFLSSTLVCAQEIAWSINRTNATPSIPGKGEILHHLYFGCTFSQNCWNILGFNWNNETDMVQKIEATRMTSNTTFLVEKKNHRSSMTNLEAKKRTDFYNISPSISS